MRKLFFLVLILSSIILAPTALAQEPDFDRINDIAKDLNCPTCAGINLADCRTQTCAQWRGQIGDLVQEGYSDQEVLDFFSARYGDQVLQEPPKRGFTLLLWVLPFIALLAAGVWLGRTMRGWSTDRQAVRASAGPARPDKPQPAADPADISDDYLKQVERDLGLDEAS